MRVAQSSLDTRSAFSCARSRTDCTRARAEFEPGFEFSASVAQALLPAVRPSSAMPSPSRSPSRSRSTIARASDKKNVLRLPVAAASFFEFASRSACAYEYSWHTHVRAAFRSVLVAAPRRAAPQLPLRLSRMPRRTDAVCARTSHTTD